MVQSIQAIMKRLILIVRAWCNTAPKPKPTREEIQVYYETLDSEDFEKWYNKEFPRTLNGEAGTKQAVEHLVNHPRHWADMEASTRIMERQRIIARQEQERRVYKVMRTKRIRRPR